MNNHTYFDEVGDLIYSILNNAQSTVKYYADIFTRNNVCVEDAARNYSEFLKIPILTKGDIRDRYSDFIHGEYEDNCDDLIREYTSGTTGEPLIILKHKAERLKSAIDTWKWRKKLFGISPNSKMAKFTSIYSEARRISDEKYKVEGNVLSFSEINVSDAELAEYNKIMEIHKIEWLFCTPTILNIYVDFLVRNEARPPMSLKYVEVAGEYFSENKYERFKRVLGCEIGNQYGSRETWAIAQTCNHNTLHVFTNNVLVELLDKDGKPVYDKEGEIYVTSLNNIVMPFIRYRLGDVGSLEHSNCPCGSKLPVLKLRMGRVGEYLICPTGEKISAIIFRFVIEELNHYYNCNLVQFQIIQEQTNKLHINLVSENDVDYSMEDKENIIEHFKEVFKRLCKYEFEMEFELKKILLPDLTTGKFNHFIQMVK